MREMKAPRHPSVEPLISMDFGSSSHVKQQGVLGVVFCQ
jgi:hypothetical protein